MTNLVLDIARRVAPAFINDLFYRSVFGEILSSPQGLEGLAKYLEYSAIEAEKFGALFLSSGRDGMAAWIKPQSAEALIPDALEKLAYIETYFGTGALNRRSSIVAFMHEKAASHVSPEAWYLSIIAVSPEAQGQGVGQRLIMPAIAEADSVHVPIYLETFEPKNWSFYNRLGFRVKFTAYEPTVGAEYALMIRP